MLNFLFLPLLNFIWSVKFPHWLNTCSNNNLIKFIVCTCGAALEVILSSIVRVFINLFWVYVLRVKFVGKMGHISGSFIRHSTNMLSSFISMRRYDPNKTQNIKKSLKQKQYLFDYIRCFYSCYQNHLQV